MLSLAGQSCALPTDLHACRHAGLDGAAITSTARANAQLPHNPHPSHASLVLHRGAPRRPPLPYEYPAASPGCRSGAADPSLNSVGNYRKQCQVPPVPPVSCFLQRHTSRAVLTSCHPHRFAPPLLLPAHASCLSTLQCPRRHHHLPTAPHVAPPQRGHAVAAQPAAAPCCTYALHAD
jgi:hypothetical protein